MNKERKIVLISNKIKRTYEEYWIHAQNKNTELMEQKQKSICYWSSKLHQLEGKAIRKRMSNFFN